MKHDGLEEFLEGALLGKWRFKRLLSFYLGFFMVGKFSSDLGMHVSVCLAEVILVG